MVAIVNGRLDESLLERVPGGQMEMLAARSWNRVRAEAIGHGHLLMPTSSVDTYRPYSVQERIFRQRYQTTYIQFAPGRVDRRIWNGTAYYRRPGTAAAAVPGTSNHGIGRAIDVANMGGFGSPKYKVVQLVATKHGWNNKAGMKIDEPWHWEYVPENDTHPAPDLPEIEDDMTPEQDNLLRHVAALLEQTPYRAAQQVMNWPVSRVAGSPTTLLQDLADTGTVARAVYAAVDPDGNGALEFPKADPQELAAAIAPLIPRLARDLSDADLKAIGKALADEHHRRLAE